MDHNQARSRAIDRLRFEQRKKRAGRPTDVAPAPGGDPDGELDLREQGRLLREALSVLTRDERQAIEMAYFSGLTYVEVATRLQRPLGTIKTRIRSALVKLRTALGDGFREP
jgi:RNA polymerase sigma-70 factor (ECF subfamily)